ncbi:MAG: hypothetical protein ACR2RV_26635 [Verrucomicrobiales bacterium]
MKVPIQPSRILALIALGVFCGMSASCIHSERFGVSGFSVDGDGSSSSYSAGTIPDLIRASKERRAGPLPESEWNRHGLWQRVAEDPAIYIVAGYGVDSPRTADAGNWFEDERDGKRVFVPLESVGEYPPSVLRGEATKVTNWQTSYKKAWSDPSSRPARY